MTKQELLYRIFGYNAFRPGQEKLIDAVLSGKGSALIDGETIELKAGDWLKVAPAAKRQFCAAADSPITYVCIQVKENSLDQYTADDAMIEQ